MKIRIHLIAAARPNFMKIGPLYHALLKQDWCETAIVHTGQHYDANMSGDFFRDLRLPDPHFHLEVGSGSHAEQTAGVMVAYERLCNQEHPDWVVVVGDVNSTAACAMVCAKLWIPVVHLEAGLRSGDRRMPEEINRLITDAISNLLWTPSEDADANLLREGVPAGRIDRVGNIMIDSFELLRDAIEANGTRNQMELAPGSYGVVTLHRPSNVDDRAILQELVAKLRAIAARIALIFPVHPRTRRRLEEFGLWDGLVAISGIKAVPPLSYIQFMNVVVGSAIAITDSGGLQEETTYLGIPCLTLRENTERPITVTQGTNQLISMDGLVDAVQRVLADGRAVRRRPERWDGKTAARCVESLRRRIG